jgi:hypothetical protein
VSTRADLDAAWHAFVDGDVEVQRPLPDAAAEALDADGRFADALAARVAALPGIARWHPIEASRVIGNIGYDLLELGRSDEARVWLARALLWDPTNPFVLEGLAEVELNDGDLDAAIALRDHLALEGYPAEHLAELDRAIEATGAPRPEVAPHQPDLDAIERLDEVGFARFAASIDDHLSDHERLRGHALACLMHGRVDVAAWTARQAAATPWWGDPERGAVETTWSAALARALDRRLDAELPRYAADDDDEWQDPDAVSRRADAVWASADAAHAGLHDPHPEVRAAAEAALRPTPPQRPRAGGVRAR